MASKTIAFWIFIFSISTLPAQIFLDRTENLPLVFTGGNSMDVESADLDGDGDLDIVIAKEFSQNYLLFNNGNGVFEVDPDRFLPEFDPGGNFSGEDSEDIGLADFDLDGDIDLLFVSEDSPNHELLLNDGTGLFTFASYQFPGSFANALGILDLNSDNAPDVIIGNRGQNQVYINIGNGNFSDQTNIYFPSNLDHTQDIKFADIDGDQDLDLIEGIELGGNNIYLNNNGVFELANNRLPNFGVVLETRKVSIGDINDDGYPDLYFCNVAWVPAADVSDRLLLNDGNGFFEDISASNISLDNQFTLDAVFLDVNGDSFQDIISTGLGVPGNNLKVWLNDGEANFTEAANEIFPSTNFDGGIGLHTADFNGDFATDVYFSNFWYNRFNVF